MRKDVLVGALIASTCLASPRHAPAGIVCPDSMYCTVSFTRTYTGSYRPGEPYDTVTIAPDGSGETFAATGITIRAILRDCNNVPFVGVPADEILLFNPALCFCLPLAGADHPTDANGVTEFTGTLRGGGCVDRLTVFVDGVAICNIPVKINSTDNVPASPCFTDGADISALASRLGTRVGDSNYSICFDYTEDGNVSGSDLSFFAAHLGSGCPP